VADTTTAAAGTTPQEKQAAAQAALGDLQQRIFFDVLASRGYVPQNDKQAMAMLETAGNVFAVMEKAALAKQAKDDDFFSAANSALTGALGKSAAKPTSNRVDSRAVEDLVTKLASNGWLEAVSEAEGKE
jgi:hypothetical protein